MFQEVRPISKTCNQLKPSWIRSSNRNTREESSERRVRDRSRQVGRDDRYIRNGIVVVIKNATILDGMPQVNRNFKRYLVVYLVE